MIYDCFTLRDELDMLELRLSVLDDVVDKFIICEADKSFTNKPKPYNYYNNRDRFAKWSSKIIYLPIELDDTGLDFNTKDTTYNPNSAAWQFEYQQRSALVYGLQDLVDGDMVMLGDVDEIPNPKDVINITTPTICVMDFYYYYVNNKSIGPVDNLWCGTAIVDRQTIASISSLQELRNIRQSLKPIKSGWHLSYMGGKDMIKTKIQTIAHTEYNRETYYSDENINHCLATGQDIFHRQGMNFKIIDPQEEYTPDVFNILKKYPQFFYEA